MPANAVLYIQGKKTSQTGSERHFVTSALEAGQKYLGTPARALMDAKRVYIAEGRLPELLRRVRDLERRLARLDGASAEEASRGE